MWNSTSSLMALSIKKALLKFKQLEILQEYSIRVMKSKLTSMEQQARSVALHLRPSFQLKLPVSVMRSSHLVV